MYQGYTIQGKRIQDYKIGIMGYILLRFEDTGMQDTGLQQRGKQGHKAGREIQEYRITLWINGYRIQSCIILRYRDTRPHT